MEPKLSPTLQSGQVDWPALGAAWEAGGLVSFAADTFGETGGVVIKVDAELKMEEPKPNIFPVTDSVGFAASAFVLGPPKPNNPPESCCLAEAELSGILPICFFVEATFLFSSLCGAVSFS